MLSSKRSVAVMISLLAALSVSVCIREGMGRESAGAVERAPYDRNVFDEMISNGAEAMGRAQHLMVGGHEALRLTCEVREGPPLAIGVIYSAEHTSRSTHTASGSPLLPAPQGCPSYMRSLPR